MIERGATHVAAQDGTTPLRIAGRKGHAYVCAMLLHRGAGEAQPSGLSPLLVAAAQAQQRAVCCALLNAGALRGVEPPDLALTISPVSHNDVFEALVRSACDTLVPHVMQRHGSNNPVQIRTQLVGAGAQVQERTHAAALRGHDRADC